MRLELRVGFIEIKVEGVMPIDGVVEIKLAGAIEILVVSVIRMRAGFAAEGRLLWAAVAKPVVNGFCVIADAVVSDIEGCFEIESQSVDEKRLTLGFE